MEKKNLAILIFNDVEVLDFAGPFEVFSVTDELNGHSLLNVYTVGLTMQPVTARNGLKIVPDYTLEDCPEPDYLVIPGGAGTRALIENQTALTWISHQAAQCENILSVCSGSLVLAKIGLLNGLKATTHREVLSELSTLAPKTEIIKDKRFVDNGKIITSAGVAAGIDMCLYMVQRLFGDDVASDSARYIEYDYHPENANICAEAV